MAFVFKSERETNPSINQPTGDLGPGQYLPQGLIGTKNLNAKFGFDSNTYREMKITKDEFPGPGSYEKNDKYEKFADLLKDKPYKSPSLLKSLEMVGPENLDPFAIIINKEKSKDVAFNSKEKRFKDSPNMDFPGPQEYGDHDPRFIVKNSIKKKKQIGNLIKRHKNSKQLIRQENGPISPFRQISIPSKNLCYGFEVNETGNLYVKDDPDKDMRYGGEKSDCVGPGSYEIAVNENWQKRGIQWERMSKNGRNSLNTSQELKKRDSLTLDSINNIPESMSNKILHTGTPVNKKVLRNNLIAFTNMGNKYISNKNEEIISNQTNRLKKDKLFKHFRDKRQKLLEMKTSKGIAEDELFDKHILNQEPGPGYYQNDIATTAFKPIKVPEKFQYFGSNSLRFTEGNAIEKNEEVGPGLYFRDDNKLGEEKKINFLKEKNNYFNNVSNSREQIKKNAGENLEERLGIAGIINQYKLANVEYSPGPGNYDMNNDYLKKQNSNVAQFGSLQKRFGENYINPTPGPGSYIGVPKVEAVNSIKFPIRPKKIPKQESKVNNTEIGLVPKEPKDENISYNSPGVGTYNNDIINSVGYRVAKHVNKFNHSSAPFNSVEKRFKKNNLVLHTENLGPGKYYKDDSEKNILRNQMNNSPPFNIGSDRKISNMEKAKIQENGPGSYNLSSYFDWNKKSFNVQFI